MLSALSGDEIPFLEIDNFIAYLKTTITSRSVAMASIFSINALIPATSISTIYPNCTPEGLVPGLAKIICWMLGPSGFVLRVGPGILVCVHLSHRPLDPELIGMQVERSIKRIFKIPEEDKGILKGTFCFDPLVIETEVALRHFFADL